MTPSYLPHACQSMQTFVDDPRVPITYYPKFREYGLWLTDSNSEQAIYFCPFCGAELPGSLRLRFYDELGEKGIDYPDDPAPLAYQSDKWWRGDE